jgi:hypothetical protein
VRTGLHTASWWSSWFLALVRIGEDSASLPVHSSEKSWVWVIVADEIAGIHIDGAQGSLVSSSLETAPHVPSLVVGVECNVCRVDFCLASVSHDVALIDASSIGACP